MSSVRPRLAFLGTGWIGRNRMETILASGHCAVCGIFDPSAEMAKAALALAPEAVLTSSLDELFDTRPDGLVVATPSALHAAQAIQALERRVAVFCQKPMGLNAREAKLVIEAAQRNDRLIGVDFSYRHTRAMRTVRRLLRAGEIGRVYAAELVFHNAYGPDKAWFYDARLSGGGCVMDLGVHLVDLLLWTLGFPAVRSARADLFCAGMPFLAGADRQVEDYAEIALGLEGGVTARLTCSWRLHAGCDAVIGATFHGTKGSLHFTNVAGSFYDFAAELRRGTSRYTLDEPPDEWGGRAALEWLRLLGVKANYRARADNFLRVAEILDRIYAAAGVRAAPGSAPAQLY